eukprot:5733236-Prymnesium_polylepis.1
MQLALIASIVLQVSQSVGASITFLAAAVDPAAWRCTFYVLGALGLCLVPLLLLPRRARQPPRELCHRRTLADSNSSRPRERSRARSRSRRPPTRPRRAPLAIASRRQGDARVIGIALRRRPRPGPLVLALLPRAVGRAGHAVAAARLRARRLRPGALALSARVVCRREGGRRERRRHRAQPPLAVRGRAGGRRGRHARRSAGAAARHPARDDDRRPLAAALAAD